MTARDLSVSALWAVIDRPYSSFVVSNGFISSPLENVFQAELDQPRSHRGPADDSEVCCPKIRAGIGKLRVIEGIVELHAESKLCVFPEASDCSGFAEGKIGIELS